MGTTTVSVERNMGEIYAARSPYPNGSPPTGHMGPMADVDTPMWAPFPNSLPPPPVATTRTAPVGQSPDGRWSTPVSQPEPKRRAKELANRRIHGARVVYAVGDLSLRNRLDEEHPTGPGNPTEGFNAMAIELARRGRDQVRMSVEMNPTIAYAK